MRARYIILLTFILLATAVSVRVFWGGPEDGWVCDGVNWVKHGNPSFSRPAGKCGNISLKDQLRECMPKSDWASHEKCLSLMKQINTFDECVSAGFEVINTGPNSKECRLADGRVFVVDAMPSQQ